MVIQGLQPLCTADNAKITIEINLGPLNETGQ